MFLKPMCLNKWLPISISKENKYCAQLTTFNDRLEPVLDLRLHQLLRDYILTYIDIKGSASQMTFINIGEKHLNHTKI